MGVVIAPGIAVMVGYHNDKTDLDYGV